MRMYTRVQSTATLSSRAVTWLPFKSKQIQVDSNLKGMGVALLRVRILSGSPNTGDPHDWLVSSYVDNRLGRGPAVLNGGKPSSSSPSLEPALSLLSSRPATAP